MKIPYKSFFSFSKSYFFLFYAFTALFILEIAFNVYEESRFYNLIENIAFSSLLFALFRIFINKFKSFYFKLLYAFVLMTALLEGWYFLSFGAELNSSAIFIALDSNRYELGEFIRFNFKLKHAVFLIALFFCFLFSWKFVNEKKIFVKSAGWYIFQVLVILLGLFLMTKERINQHNFPFVLYSSVIEYITERNLIDQIESNAAPFEDVQLLSERNETHVVVIGESTSRLHFGLYGYYRQTTPRLNEISDELFIFDNVVSGDTYTVGSLTKALVVKDKGAYAGNLIQLFNQASFKTFWVSNQPPIGIYETLVTKIALSSDYTLFTTTESPEKLMNFDGVLLEHLDKALHDPSPRKVIFIHLMGTHADYEYRYPKSFDVFKSEIENKKQQTIDHYDNAVLYNDYILREIIEKVRNNTTRSSVIYFSDHGEEVYDSIEFAGHSVNGDFTLNLVEIPFLYWNNMNKKVPNNFLQRPFILNDLTHSLADLYGIYAKQIDTTKSIFHNSFKPQKRIIRENIIINEKN